MKKIIVALSLMAAFNAQAALIVGNTYQDSNATTWTYLGDYNVGDGPSWHSGTTPVYSAVDAATLVFGTLAGTQQYAISTSDTLVNHMAWYDGYGDGTYLPTYNSYGSGYTLAENFFADTGSAGYNGFGDYSAYIGDDRASFGGGAFNHVFVSATSVPEPTSIALIGIALLGFATTRRKSAK